jgi:hypothetical protein
MSLPAHVEKLGGTPMFRALTLTLFLIAPLAVRADDLRFRFAKGQVLAYTIVQTTKATETTIDAKTGKPKTQEHVTRHTVQRQWKVADIDIKGMVTLEMSIAAMKWEQQLPNGETDVFDSAKPDDLNKNEMARLIGPVLAVLRIDPLGKLIEVKESKFGNKSRFEADLPFKIVLPPSGPKDGQTWDRTYTIKLDPPQGTGETYEATQKYTAKAPVNGLNTIAISTTIKDVPAQVSDQIPLLPMLMEGDVFFHAASGRYHGARLKVKKELLNHQGEGTKYVFESVYSEDLKVEK